MEFITTAHPIEQTETTRREIAEEIHTAIISSIKTLLREPGISEQHSSVQELRQEATIAARALRYYEEKTLLHDAA